jgi:carbonic anhydrase
MATYLLLCALLVGSAFAAEEAFEFSYDAQNVWPGICVENNTMRQSPINIVVDDVVIDTNLIELQLNGFDSEIDGLFFNNGATLQFDLANAGEATVMNHIGTYDVLQFHMHWGTMTGEGSEHTINGEQGELEIHFVQKMQGAQDSSAGDYLSVLAVLADVDANAPIDGPWEQLSAMTVQSFGSNTSINNFRLDSLLPTDVDLDDYYFYEGSLTSPGCGEIVVWFVLEDRITVPGAYLEMLRQVQQDAEGTPLPFNFRMTQDLGGRQVAMPGASATTVAGASPTQATPIITLLTLALVKIFS